jgi:3-deoxy-D-manno-octulosonic acid (KDO) 8-phosphate synthase
MGLTDSVATILGLIVHRRIKVAVVHDDTVCGRQVDTYAARSRGQQKAVNALVCLKRLDRLGALFFRSRAVNSTRANAHRT